MPATIIDRLFSSRTRWLGRRFDRRNGVETTDVLRRDELIGMAPELRQHASAYVPSNLALFTRIVRKSGIDPKEFTFVDLGCGKGRVLMAAAEFAFKSIIGIEADAELCAVAVRNLNGCAPSHDRSRTSIIHADARTFDVPAGNLFIFMYDPFQGAIFEAVAKHLAMIASDPGRAVVIAYSADWEGDRLDRTGQFVRRRMRRRQFWAPPSVSFFYNATADRMRQSRWQAGKFVAGAVTP